MTITSYKTAIIPYVSVDNFLAGEAAKQAKYNRLMEDLLRLVHQALAATRPTSPIVETFQAEAAFSHASDPKPVLASYGAGPCIIAGGYNLEERVGFIAHFSHPGEVEVGAAHITRCLSRMLKSGKGAFSLTLKGGIVCDPTSVRTYKTIKKWVRTQSQAHDVTFRIAANDPLKHERDPSKSLVLDTRTGKHGDYDPLRDNPHHYRRVTMADIRRAEASFEKTPTLDIVYVSAN